MNLDAAEMWRIQRARCALLLHIPPAAVDDMPLDDIDDVLAINLANSEIEAWLMRKK